MSPEFKPLYEACVAAVQALVEMDPDPATPEGKLLVGLATAVEEFEKAEFAASDREGKPPCGE